MVLSPATETPVWPLFKTVVSSILEVVLVCLSGYVLARQGVLDKKIQHQLNTVNISLFTPCLLFSKVAFSLSPGKLKELWIVPIFFLAVTVISMGVAWVLGGLFRLKPSQTHFAMAAAMFMNSNSLPIALLQSLAVSVPGLEWGDDDSKDAMVGRALSYLVVCSTLGMIIRWSYGVRLLSKADPAEVLEPEPEEEHRVRGVAEARPLLGAGPPGAGEYVPVLIEPLAQPTDGRIQAAIEVPDVPASFVENPAAATHPDLQQAFYAFPPEEQAEESSLEEGPPSEGEEEHVLPPARRRPSTPTSTRRRAVLRRTRHRIISFFRKLTAFMTAPLWASLFSIFVALIQPLQHALDMHLAPVKGALAQLGDCSIPITLVVLGAYFYRPPPGDGEKREGVWEKTKNRWRRVKSQASLKDSLRELIVGTEEDKKGPHRKRGTHHGEGRTVLVSILARMIITPAVFIPIMIWGASTDFPNIFEDPVFILSIVILVSSPPALTLAQMTQAAAGDAFERLISRTVFWSYCVVTAPVTIVYAVIAMMIAKI